MSNLESPFYPNDSSIAESGSFIMFLEPILDSFSKTYFQVITLSAMPPGPISNMVKLMPFPKLSSFSASSTKSCGYVLLRYPKGVPIKNACEYMFSSDIPAVFSYLEKNGYSIDSKLTKMINGSKITIGNQDELNCANIGYSSCSGSNRRLICFVSYSNPK